MATAISHITVCICTFKRPVLLKGLLQKLVDLRTEGFFTYSVVVADNDAECSAKDVVAEFSGSAPFPVTYCVEPQQNIALVRNWALQYATGDWIAFIDDDEFPSRDWLYNLLQTQAQYQADGVLGPVKPLFQTEPPRWVMRGRFFERPTYETGRQLSSGETRTGNVLLRRSMVSDGDIPFNPEFGTGGEDVDFFGRMMKKRYRFVWCNEAPVFEDVPQSRCSRSYLLKRALLRGSNRSKISTGRVKSAVKSLIAVPCYTLALPVLALLGQHVLIKYLIKLGDHTGRIWGFLGIPLVTRREM